MTLAKTLNNNVTDNFPPANWSIVGLLFFLTGIAGIPAIFLVAMVALGPSATGEVSTIINVAHFETPMAIYLHGGFGILFFLTMPFQFSPKLRVSNPQRHKIAGRVAVISAFVMATSGVWMHNVLTPESQGIRYFILILTSAAICLTFSIALMFAIKRNIAQHRIWMARAVAVTLAAVTPLFVELLSVVLFSHFEQFFAVLTKLQYDYGRLLGMAINLAIAEIIISKKAL
ncbi:DUF2306 domain-containing protein [Thalassotalea sp. M1531]|uniref:DUF2306 domain-containing protein n=1 Tax=Thalassotalea algicola TaxID=2716224 RepID=A0A7Y0Q5T0_9GAMM|nr:DUF2306 domain-containing protein [Thalassotalea algicola]NMP30663.1 DUF2306 domain-containing protein [Thalassotalea algicola]